MQFCVSNQLNPTTQECVIISYSNPRPKHGETNIAERG
jgi:hypothetical protein